MTSISCPSFYMAAPVKKATFAPTAIDCSYQNTIKMALKADHQVYTLEKLQPFVFTDIPSLPSALNLVFCPYEILKNLVTLLKGKIKGFHQQKIEAGVKITSNFANLVNSAFVVLGYIAAFHLITFGSITFLPFVLVSGFIFSTIELCLNLFHLYQDREFKNLITTKLMKPMSDLIKEIRNETVDQKKIFKKAYSLLKKVNAESVLLESKYSPEYVEKLQSKLHDLCFNFKTYAKQGLVKKYTRTIYFDFVKEFCIKNLSSIGENYLTLSESEKIAHEINAEKNKNRFGEKEGLLVSFKEIQEAFRKKKLSLARRIEPKETLKFVNQYHTIINQLKSPDKQAQVEGANAAAPMFLKMKTNASINQTLHLAACVTYAFVIVSFITTIVFPIGTVLPVVLLGLASVFSLICHFIRKGNLESKDNYFDFYNCIPQILRAAGEKIKGFLQTKPISAVNLTDSIQKERRA